MSDVPRRDPLINQAIEILDRHWRRSKFDYAVAFNTLGTVERTFIKQELKKCILTPRYYLENYHVIQTEDEGFKTLYPFWDSQEIFYTEIMEMVIGGKPVKVLVLKSRQLGLSTISEGLIFHRTIFNRAVNSLIVAQDPGQSAYLFDMFTRAYDFLPWWMQPEKLFRSKGRYMVFATDKPDREGLNSQIMVEAANKLTGVSVGKCTEGDSHIWTDKGPLSIQTIFERFANPISREVDKGGGEWFTLVSPLSVPSFDGDKQTLKAVTKIYRQRYAGSIQKIKIGGCPTIGKTPAHRLLSGEQWVNDVHEGDWISRFRKLDHNCTNTEFSPDEAELLAWQLSEGTEHGNALYITQSDPDMRKHIHDLAHRVSRWDSIYNREGKKGKAGYVYARSNAYKHSLLKKGHQWGLVSGTKRIPELLYGASLDAITRFLRAYAEAEGSSGHVIEITTKSRAMAEGLRFLFAKFGIWIRFTSCYKYASNTTKKTKRLYWRGSICGSNLVRFCNQIGFISERKQKELERIAGKAAGSRNVERDPFTTVLLREVCRNANISGKLVMGSLKYMSEQLMGLEYASQSASRLRGIATNLPLDQWGNIHYAYRQASVAVLQKYATEVERVVSLPLAYDQVVRREDEPFDGYVYDLEVEDTHNYCISGVISHNTIRAGHLSELSAWDDPTTLTEQIFPTMNAKDELAIMESTARGRSGRGKFWYDFWNNSVNKWGDGLWEWKPIFIEWFRCSVSTIDKKASVGKYARSTAGEDFIPTVDEVSFRDKVKRDTPDHFVIPDEMLKWRRYKIDETIAATGDAYGFAQEYCANHVEAFISSGTCAFPRELLNRIMSTDCYDPDWIGEIEYHHEGQKKYREHLTDVREKRRLDPTWKIPSTDYPGGRLRIWEKPISGESYYIGADVAHGIEGRDYSCAQVIRIGRGGAPDEQVAEWHGWISPTPFGDTLAALGYYYNTCEVSSEINDCGQKTYMQLFRILNYPQLFRWKHYDRVKHFYSDLMAWQTNSKTRPLLITNMRERLMDNVIKFHSLDLLDELFTFASDDDGGRFEGQDNNDDLCFAAMISLWCAHDSDYGKQAEMSMPLGSSGYFVLDGRGQVVAQCHRLNEDTKQYDPITRDEAVAALSINRTWSVRRQVVKQDFVNSDFSPVHDRQGLRSQMHYEMGIPAEKITGDNLIEGAGTRPEDDWRNV